MENLKIVYATRRVFLTSLATAPVLACTPANRAGRSRTPRDIFADIEFRTDGRVGIAARNLATGQTILFRENERFAMCSTFKWLLAALILQCVEAGEEQLDRRIVYDADDLVFYSPVTEEHVGSGLSVAELCAATVGISDNTAANLLINILGGPTGFTIRVRAIGDQITRLDRLEPRLNQNAAGDPQDTSTPAAMINTMQRLLFGDILSGTSRRLLQGWMIDANTGLDRLRAGLPDDWVTGDKTGTSQNAQNNDLAFALPPPDTGRAPIIIVSYLNIPDPIGAQANALHEEIARTIVAEFDI